MLNNSSNEIWKDIPGYEGLYKISNKQRVRSINRDIIYSNGVKHHTIGKILKPQKNKQGYLFVILTKNNKPSAKYIHQLMAKVFIPNPNNLLFINHKDENKSNNSIENLEWCTISYNNNYGTRTQKTRKKICQYTTDYKLIKIWDGIRVASRVLNISSQQISQCCKKQKYRHTAGGYIWEYLERSDFDGL